MFNKVHVGDCRSVMAGLPKGGVDLVVTSPPYWALRDYQTEPVIWGGDSNCNHDFTDEIIPQRGNRDIGFNERWGNSPGLKKQEKKNVITSHRGICVKCGAWRGSLGLESHPQLYVDHVVDVCRGMRRVLKPTGSLWLNLGDSYHSGGRPGKTSGRGNNKRSDNRVVNPDNTPNRLLENDGGWLQPKQLLGIPWRVAAALQEDEWILRNCIVWHKPNHMPEPVKDRLTKSYEFVFFFVKERHYYFDLDEIRTPHQRDWRFTGGSLCPTKDRPQGTGWQTLAGNNSDNRPAPPQMNPLGKNPGDMWTIPTHPFKGAHFAVFPESLVEPIIKAASPVGGVVLDPFAGSGTTLRVARRLGRSWIGIEINPEYAEMCLARVKADDYQETPEGVKPLSSFTR